MFDLLLESSHVTCPLSPNNFVFARSSFGVYSIVKNNVYTVKKFDYRCLTSYVILHRLVREENIELEADIRFSHPVQMKT